MVENFFAQTRTKVAGANHLLARSNDMALTKMRKSTVEILAAAQTTYGSETRSATGENPHLENRLYFDGV
jgi:hypothetical protein